MRPSTIELAILDLVTHTEPLRLIVTRTKRHHPPLALAGLDPCHADPQA